jgi:putative membrane protein
MLDFLVPYYLWIKALHVIAVITWMAALFYLPRLFVYHAERATVGSELDQTFQVMEEKLARLIMRPSMIVAWIFGLLLIGMGGLDFSAVWGWAKLISVIAMTVFHVWLVRRGREFAAGRNTRTGRNYRIANEAPTILMLIIVVAVVVEPF